MTMDLVTQFGFKAMVDAIVDVKEFLGGGGIVFRFSNGRGASVVRHEFSYGSKQGLFELAVVRFMGSSDESFELDYSTEVTSDVEGYLTGEGVMRLLEQIKALPPAAEGESLSRPDRA
jgi:hypothetical protein